MNKRPLLVYSVDRNYANKMLMMASDGATFLIRRRRNSEFELCVKDGNLFYDPIRFRHWRISESEMGWIKNSRLFQDENKTMMSYVQATEASHPTLDVFFDMVKKQNKVSSW